MRVNKKLYTSGGVEAWTARGDRARTRIDQEGQRLSLAHHKTRRGRARQEAWPARRAPVAARAVLE
eukprot:CAMPEP_0182881024 /NCGR_PEP_ID=MMETSP0034_2-20130328/16925_1 /TAXON_ID=156128 /ORGANISM="Nephroselmis pyriformis, Strain CCMP717" /LENGTH=65 /DNA_ID=CAMNT_0025014037 /DNA_START=12 /DNA_END=209 /DNA_ORIENTATION=-